MTKVYRRRRWDDDDPSHFTSLDPAVVADVAQLFEPTDDEPGLPPGAHWSGYADADQRGPTPLPPWLVTHGDALDHERGVLKTGKEAEVHLVERIAPDGTACLLASKRYRSREHRNFHRDAGYLEGRRVRRSREMRAMANRTAIGLEIIAAQWAVAEFGALARLWELGVPVPYPVQRDGTDLVIEFVGDADGTAAPRLAQLRPDRAGVHALWLDLWSSLCLMADAGLTHGDLSAYNLLVHHERVWVIDLPQIVDVVGNPQGPTFLRRDVANVAAWFGARGLVLDAERLSADLLDRALGR